MSASVRAFLAMEIPSNVRTRLVEVTDHWRRQLPKASWVRPENLHLTLKFLGDVDQVRLDRLSQELEPPLRKLEHVTVDFVGAGCFPARGRPRVAWIGGRAAGVEPVTAAVESAATTCGFERDRRPWRLHLTVGRPRGGWGAQDVDLFSELGGDLVLPCFEVAEVVLFASELRPTGAVYTRLRSFPLK